MSPVVYMTWPMYTRQQCQYNGHLVQLTPRTADTLLCLLLKRGIPLKASELIEFIYPDPDKEPEWAENCVMRWIHFLRKSIPGVVLTENTRGYYIERLG